MPESSRPSHARLRALGVWCLRIGFALGLALLLCRFLYTTTAGLSVLDSIPAELWSTYERLLGLERAGVEAAMDANLALVLPACLIVSAASTAGFELCLRRARRAASG